MPTKEQIKAADRIYLRAKALGLAIEEGKQHGVTTLVMETPFEVRCRIIVQEDIPEKE